MPTETEYILFAANACSASRAEVDEIKTSKRRVIEYFLSPLRQYKDESLRER